MKTAEVQDTFHAYRSAVYGWAYRVLGNHHDAQDVAQEVFVKWWRANRDAAPPTNATGWLRRVTINHSLNLRKARRVGESPATLPVAAEYDMAEEADLETVRHAVADAMGLMSEHQRVVLFAKVYDGLAFSEIAEQIGLSIPTVKTHYLRAIQAVRKQLVTARFPRGVA